MTPRQSGAAGASTPATPVTQPSADSHEGSRHVQDTSPDGCCPVLNVSSREIPLTRGLVALVDEADFEWLSRYKWHAARGTNPYAATMVAGRTVYMHRLVMGVASVPHKIVQVDHINRERADNRRENLRLCTHSENMQNRDSLWTQYRRRGVFPRGRGKWQARIMADRVLHDLGIFSTPEAAALAYDAAARELHGEFAYLNFPDEVTR